MPLLPPQGRVPAPLLYIPSLMLPTSPAIIYLLIIALSPANCSFPPCPWPETNPPSVRWAHRLDIQHYLKFPPIPLSILPTIGKLCQMPHLARPTLCRQNALAKKHHFPFELFFYIFSPNELLLSPLLPQPFTSALLFHQQLDKTAPACSCAIALSISFHHFHTSSSAPQMIVLKARLAGYTASIFSSPYFQEILTRNAEGMK